MKGEMSRKLTIPSPLRSASSAARLPLVTFQLSQVAMTAAVVDIVGVALRPLSGLKSSPKKHRGHGVFVLNFLCDLCASVSKSFGCY